LAIATQKIIMLMGSAIKTPI